MNALIAVQRLLTLAKYAEVLVRESRDCASARSSRDKAQLHQIRLTYVLESNFLLIQRRGKRSETDLAKRSRGTPRIANRLLKRVRDFAEVLGNGKITRSIGLPSRRPFQKSVPSEKPL